LFSGKAITSSWYSDHRMQAWVDRTHPNCNAVFVSSAAMAQYIANPTKSQPRVIDLVDVDSDKWQQYAQNAAWFKRWIFQREATLISALEIEAGKRFDHLTLVSQSEADFFHQLHPQIPSAKVIGVSNGVDTDFFDTTRVDAANQQIVAGRIVFTGEMNYKPNIDAVLWFAEQVWPQILARQPQASFVIVGRHPTTAIRALHARQNIEVTGRVEDVRPWLASAAVVVAPMLLARGLKNKVLEAMAMAKPLVATPQALYGLQQLPDSPELQIATTATEFVEACLRQLQQPCTPAAAHRDYVLKIFSWQRRLAPLFSMLNLDEDGQHK
jgi:sugar transferase (PEP-CTERM/EpsH1 system associated)